MVDMSGLSTLGHSQHAAMVEPLRMLVFPNHSDIPIPAVVSSAVKSVPQKLSHYTAPWDESDTLHWTPTCVVGLHVNVYESEFRHYGRLPHHHPTTPIFLQLGIRRFDAG
jgi:hypothetical protein